MIFHLCEAKAWEAAKRKNFYEAESLKKEGFIHFSTLGQIIAVANFNYRSALEPILLVVDNNRINQNLKWEGTDGLEFPHLYRKVEIQEVIEVIPMKKDSDGNFILHEALKKAANAVELESENLILRELQIEDASSILTYASDPEIVKHMPWGPNDLVMTHEFLTRNFKFQTESPRKKFDFAVVQKTTGKQIGGCGLFVKGQDTGSAFIGYILQKDAQNKGFGTEMAKTLIKFGFSTLGLHRIDATCGEQNKASLSVMIKSGMIQEGLLRDYTFFKGKRHNTIICSILRSEI